ncbi:MAG: response regulator [Chloroflexota bacterium]|nr:response regulator [Chloroflexota bacterium]
MARVLLVEDDTAIRDLMMLALEDADHVAWSVSDGREALPAAMAARPDVIVLDYLLPFLHGGEVIAQLNGNPELARIPVVLCTALSPCELDLNSLPARVTPLFKPFDLDTFLDLVSRLCPTLLAPVAVPTTMPEAAE